MPVKQGRCNVTNPNAKAIQDNYSLAHQFKRDPEMSAHYKDAARMAAERPDVPDRQKAKDIQYKPKVGAK